MKNEKTVDGGALRAALWLCVFMLACGENGPDSAPIEDGMNPSASRDAGEGRHTDSGDEGEDGRLEAPRPVDAGAERPDAAQQSTDGSTPDPVTHADASARDAAVASDGGHEGALDAAAPYANSFFDGFDSFQRDVWGCEYTCPTFVQGLSRFTLKPGIPPNNEGSWSKISYRPRRFTAGRFTVRFALTARPRQTVWWGTALWDDGPSPDGSQFNEINFGYTTPHSFTNTQLYFESAKRGNAVSVKVDTGVDLYDGAFHTATLEYDAEHVAFYFDGVLMETITDLNVIPTDPMKFIIGPRLVTGSAPLAQEFIESVDYAELAW